MVEVIITYETLYEILRREKVRPEIQKLDLDFIKNTINYLNEKSAILKSQKEKESVFAAKEIERTGKQIENIKRLIKELYERRETKIIQLSLSSARSKLSPDLSNLIQEEKEFYTKIKNILNNNKENVLNQILKGKLPKREKPKTIKNEEKSLKLVRFNTPVPKFVGEDLNVYGPFWTEDVANLPIKISDLLIKKNRAKEI
ncbi:hypothetical protein K8R47_03990 [archaeon]|nr:hypothetical protein [archaeon]